jgi:hypothetical protein
MGLFVAIAVLLALAVFAVVLRPLWRESRGLVIGGFVALGLATFALYRLMGAPTAADQLAANPMPVTLDEAILQLQAELERNPNQPQGWLLLGKSLASQGKIAEASDALAQHQFHGHLRRQGHSHRFRFQVAFLAHCIATGGQARQQFHFLQCGQFLRGHQAVAIVEGQGQRQFLQHVLFHCDRHRRAGHAGDDEDRGVAARTHACGEVGIQRDLHGQGIGAGSLWRGGSSSGWEWRQAGIGASGVDLLAQGGGGGGIDLGQQGFPGFRGFRRLAFLEL